MIVNNIEQAVKAFNSIDEWNEDEILDSIAYAIEDYASHNEAIELTDIKGFEEIGYDSFEPSDTNLFVYTDLYNAMLRRGVNALDFIAFAHLRYTTNDEGRTFYKNVNQVIY